MLTYGDILWSWEFSSESGIFFTAGELDNGNAPIGKYEIKVDSIRVNQSVIPHNIFTNYVATQSPLTFDWNGSTATNFQRGGGYYNSSIFFRADWNYEYLFSDAPEESWLEDYTQYAASTITFRVTSGPITVRPISGIAPSDEVYVDRMWLFGRTNTGIRVFGLSSNDTYDIDTIIDLIKGEWETEYSYVNGVGTGYGYSYGYGYNAYSSIFSYMYGYTYGDSILYQPVLHWRQTHSPGAGNIYYRIQKQE